MPGIIIQSQTDGMDGIRKLVDLPRNNVIWNVNFNNITKVEKIGSLDTKKFILIFETKLGIFKICCSIYSKGIMFNVLLSLSGLTKISKYKWFKFKFNTTLLIAAHKVSNFTPHIKLGNYLL